MGDTGRRVHRKAAMLKPRRCCDELLNPPFRNFHHYRLRAQLAARGHRPWRKTRTHAQL